MDYVDFAKQYGLPQAEQLMREHARKANMSVVSLTDYAKFRGFTPGIFTWQWRLVIEQILAYRDEVGTLEEALLRYRYPVGHDLTRKLPEDDDPNYDNFWAVKSKFKDDRGKVYKFGVRLVRCPNGNIYLFD
jgi:hypothetical protein